MATNESNGDGAAPKTTAKAARARSLPVSNAALPPDDSEPDKSLFMVDSDIEDDLDIEQLDLFHGQKLPDSWKPREDLYSLEFPLFVLQKGRYLKKRTYVNERFKQKVVIIPSVEGAANIFDKDLLVYATTLISRANDAKERTSRRVRFKVRDFLNFTHRSTGGASYERVVESCRRLKGTTIETNFDPARPGADAHGVHLDARGYGLIDEYRVTSHTGNRKGALEIEIVLSTWTYDSLLNGQVLTIHPGYFELGQGLERRLYDLAKKHCGDKLWFKFGLKTLHVKSGASQELKYFRRDLLEIMKADSLPEFHVAVDDVGKSVIFFRCNRDNKTRDQELTAGIHQQLLSKRLQDWYYSLLRWDRPNTPRIRAGA